VKQAEMFAAIRSEFDIERDENLALRDYPTLARAIEFVYEKRPDLSAATGGAATGSAVAGGAATGGAAAGGAAAPVLADMGAAQAVPRRVPVARVRPRLALFAPSGVTMQSGDRVVVRGDG